MKSLRLPMYRLLIASVLVVIGLVTLQSSVRAQSFKRHALIEEGTGTWCGYCPYGAYTLDSIRHRMGDQAVILSWHGPKNYNEPMYNAAIDTLVTYVKATGYPWSSIGRLKALTGAYEAFPNPWYTTAQTQARQAPLVDFRVVNVTYTPSNRSVDFDVDVTPFDARTMPKEDTTSYVLVGAVTEDGVVESQHRYASKDGVLPDAQIDDFVHYNVVRKMGGAVLGDPISLGTKAAISLPARKHYHITLAADWKADSIRVKAFVARKSKVDANGESYLDAGQTGYVTALPATAPSALWVVLPRKGDVVASDSSQLPIVWAKGGGAASTVKMEYTVDAGTTWMPIVSSTNLSPFLWTLPLDAYGKMVQVRVTDVGNASLSSTSESFTIQARTVGTIAVTNPTNGEILLAGSTYRLYFTTSGPVTESRMIELSVDNGLTYTLVGSVTGVTNYDWTVPNVTATNSAIIRVKDGANVNGLSGSFSIVQPGHVSMVSILGAPMIATNSMATITWTGIGYIGERVAIDYSPDGKATWTNVDTGASVTGGSYAWHTPATPTTRGVIRLTFGGISAVMYSDPFTLQAAGVAGSARPGEFILYQNYPNPFASTTDIQYELGSAAIVTLTVSDALGREVSRLATGMQQAGVHTANFDAKQLAAGSYTYRLLIGETTFLGKMTITK